MGLPLTMKQLLIYAEQQKKLRASEHRRKHAHDGKCSGLSDAEYNRVKHPQKSTFTKARKFTHNRMWKHQSRYSVKQLIEIVKQ